MSDTQSFAVFIYVLWFHVKKYVEPVVSHKFIDLYFINLSPKDDGTQIQISSPGIFLSSRKIFPNANWTILTVVSRILRWSHDFCPAVP